MDILNQVKQASKLVDSIVVSRPGSPVKCFSRKPIFRDGKVFIRWARAEWQITGFKVYRDITVFYLEGN